MYVHISWRTAYRSKGWSLGYCAWCEQEGVVRLEKVLQVLYLYELVPLSKSDKGQVARCDFCGRSVEEVRDWDGVDLTDWSHQDGIVDLYKKLGVSNPVGPSNATSDTRLRSLLSAVQETSSFTKIGVGPVGIVGGCIVAVLIAIPLAQGLHQNQLAPPQIDEVGFTILLTLGSLLPGAILGAVIEALIRRRRGVATRIREAYEKYPFDLYRMEELSYEYGKNVQRAVKDLIDEVPRRS